MLKQIVILFVFFVPFLHAADVDHLYQAEVLVADQGQQERNRAIADGFLKILVKVTGNRNIGQSQSLAATFPNASRYVQQYRYRLFDRTENEQEKRYLRITFDKQAVDRTLRENGLPVWGKSRPQIISWIGFDDNGKRKLLMPEFDQSVINILNHAADSRGIPLLFPVMDLQDHSAISASDLWGAFEGPVSNASERYQADSILMVRVKTASGGFIRTSWSLLGNGDTRQWEFNGNSLEKALYQGVQALSDYLASVYAPAGGGETQIVYMQISALNTFADLVKVESFMKNQETVQQYQLRQSQSDKSIFALSLRGGLQAFIQAVELSGMFQVEDMMFTSVEPQPDPEPIPATVAFSQQAPQEVAGQKEAAVVSPDDMVLQAPVAFSKDPLTDIHLYYRLR
jgi:hypothetical protein